MNVSDFRKTREGIFSVFDNCEQAAYYLAAMIDGEGSVIFRPIGPKRRSVGREVRVSNTDEDILEATRTAMRMLGVKFTEYLELGKDERHPRDCMTLRVGSRDSLEIIWSRVPIMATRKRDTLRKCIESYRFAKAPDASALSRIYGTKTDAEVAVDLGISKFQVGYYAKQYGLSRAA